MQLSLTVDGPFGVTGPRVLGFVGNSETRLAPGIVQTLPLRTGEKSVRDPKNQWHSAAYYVRNSEVRQIITLD